MAGKNNLDSNVRFTMNAIETYQVVFPECYDERGEWEAKEKGWLQGVEVGFSNGEVHRAFLRSRRACAGSATGFFMLLGRNGIVWL